MTTLRDRCEEFLSGRLGVINVDDLLGFVLSEKGRDADSSLADTLPMVLYFGNEADREEFRALYREMHPNVRQLKLP